MSTSLNAAVLEGELSVNPCVATRKPKLPPTPERYLTDAECSQIRAKIEELRPDFLVLFDLMLWPGMRFGEATGLHWSQVDTSKRVIEVRWAWDRQTGSRKAPKSHQVRTVPIPRKSKIDGTPQANTLPGDTYRGGKRPQFGLVTGERVTYTEWRNVWRPSHQGAGRGPYARSEAHVRVSCCVCRSAVAGRSEAVGAFDGPDDGAVRAVHAGLPRVGPGSAGLAVAGRATEGVIP